MQFHVSAAELDVRGSGPSVGRVGSGRVGSQNSPSSAGQVGSGAVSKISNKYAIYIQEIRRL